MLSAFANLYKCSKLKCLLSAQSSALPKNELDLYPIVRAISNCETPLSLRIFLTLLPMRT